MGKLRDKAEAGLKNKRERDAEVRRKRDEERKQAHAESVQPVVDYLSEWSGEEISPDDLKPVDTQIGPPQWDVVLDGFELRISVIGKPPEDVKVCIEQNIPEGGFRDIFEPHDLLAPMPQVP